MIYRRPIIKYKSYSLKHRQKTLKIYQALITWWLSITERCSLFFMTQKLKYILCIYTYSEEMSTVISLIYNRILWNCHTMIEMNRYTIFTLRILFLGNACYPVRFGLGCWKIVVTVFIFLQDIFLCAPETFGFPLYY